MSKALARVVSPSLPTWPPLWFDAQKRQAVVKARLATWRSHQWALGATRYLSGCLWLVLSFMWWRSLPNESGRWFPFLIGVAVILSAVSLLHIVIKAASKDFLARQIFARRVTVWFTPGVIAFRSPLYANGVWLCRVWNGVRVKFKFDLTKDHHAEHQHKMLTHEKRGDGQHLELAYLLRVLIATDSRASTGQRQPTTNLMRAIPVSEISLLDAERMTMVLSAAASLTARGNDEHDHQTV
ncbi:hypothetical protein N9N28_17900, partial [Rubripirellula amarantea]|nr:hypothetical protein [Rubripirellula amarantea]